MKSDGTLYEIKNWREANVAVSNYKTDFKSSNNMESLTYSDKINGLLTVPKDKDAKDDFKGIYEISLDSKNTDMDSPTYKIDLNDKVLKAYKEKKIEHTLSPSEIAIHPKTHDIYVLEGKQPKLLILNSQGQLKKAYKLDQINFPQPEGMTFSADGKLYISNESVGKGATIHLVEMNF